MVIEEYDERFSALKNTLQVCVDRNALTLKTMKERETSTHTTIALQLKRLKSELHSISHSHSYSRSPSSTNTLLVKDDRKGADATVKREEDADVCVCICAYVCMYVCTLLLYTLIQWVAHT